MPERADDPRRLIGWTIAAVAGAVVLLWFLYLVREVLLLVYVSALFAIGTSPLVRLIERQRLLPVGARRFPRWLAILSVYVVILGVLVAAGLMVVPPLVRQARDLTRKLPDYAAGAQEYLIARGILTEPITLREAIEQAPGRGTDAVGTVLGALWVFFGGVVGVLTILILTFYILVEAEAMLTTFVRLFPRRRRAQVARVSREITLKVSAWLGGQLLLGAIIGGSAAVVLGLMGVPYFYVLALLAAVGEMIPVVGPIVAAIPGIAVAWTVSGKLALGVAVFYLIQQQVENHFLVPKLMERQLGVSAATVIVALLVGAALLGVVGVLLAVPTAAIVRVLLQELVLKEDDAGSA